MRHTDILPALRRLLQMDFKLKASLSYTVNDLKLLGGKVPWLTPIIPALRRLEQRNLIKFRFALGYVASSRPA